MPTPPSISQLPLEASYPPPVVQPTTTQQPDFYVPPGFFYIPRTEQELNVQVGQPIPVSEILAQGLTYSQPPPPTPLLTTPENYLDGFHEVPVTVKGSDIPPGWTYSHPGTPTIFYNFTDNVKSIPEPSLGLMALLSILVIARSMKRNPVTS